MIIITGPGRSGTSLVAKLYLELGFDPGGSWMTSVDAGLEEKEVVSANLRIMEAVGFGHLGPPIQKPSPLTKPLLALWERFAPQKLDDYMERLVYRMPTLVSRRRGFMRWDKLDEVIERFGPELRRVAQSRDVAKDPRFLWTLGTWADAGAAIDHVVICIRSLDAMIKSRVAAGHLRFMSRAEARTSIVYGLGLCMSALYDHKLSYSIQRFPDFLDDPDQLYRALRFPQQVSRADFQTAFERIVDRDLVHDSA